MDNLLEIKNFTVDIKLNQTTLNILKNVSFSIQPGEIVALVGPSGSGKTMTTRAILGLLPKSASVTSGEIKLTGKQIGPQGKLSYQDIRGNYVSMIFQEPHAYLNPVLKIGKQLSDVIKQHNKLESSRDIETKVKDILRDVGFSEPDEIIKVYPHQLSGGMAQRVLIALALSCRPLLLIADEPTTALDSTTQLQILKLLTHLQKKEKFAILLISHDKNVVSAIADKIIVLEDGQIVDSYENVIMNSKPIAVN